MSNGKNDRRSATGIIEYSCFPFIKNYPEFYPAVLILSTFMRCVLTIFIISACFFCKAQQSFITLVPQQPVVAGESFQVQYTISNAEKVSGFNASSSFESFRFVSGPDIYNGKMVGINGMQPIKNYVFTLEAIRPGYFTIQGARATVDGKHTISNTVIVEVISKEEAANRNNSADNSAYQLRPGEDPYKKIRQNLFLKVMVDKKGCFTGEPVLATFKLYSRLQSRSDILKNPGFYGFTVYDMVNLDNNEMVTENVNGKLFDVHTIRKVQLFPLQPGIFTIDAMEVRNRVEFSKSIVNKKTEQQIVEGVLNNDKDGQVNENAEVFETTIRTEPIMIKVKPVPVADRPSAFNGATGMFNITTLMPQSKLTKNEEGFLDVRISGQGNFTQLNAPAIDWPDGIEGFEPVIRDSLDKTKFPLSGSRTFHYGFVSSKPGKYQFPPVNFYFFDPGNKNFKTLSSSAFEIQISNEEKISKVKEEKKASITEKNAKAGRTAGIIIVSILIVVLVYWIRYKREPVNVDEEKKFVLPTVDELLAPAQMVFGGDDKDFYSSLHQCIWNFLALHFNLSGSDMNKKKLTAALLARQIKEGEVSGMILALEQCEAGMFTNAAMQENKEVIFQRVKLILERVSGQLL